MGVPNQILHNVLLSGQGYFWFIHWQIEVVLLHQIFDWEPNWLYQIFVQRTLIETRLCLVQTLVADCFLVTYSGAGSVWCLVWTGGLQVCSWWCSAAPASPAFPFKVGPSYYSPITVLLLLLGKRMAWFGVRSSFNGETNLPTNSG